MHSRAELNWVEQSREYTHITHRIIPSLASKIKMFKSCRSNRLFGHNSRKVLWPQIMMANKFLAETKSGDHGCCVARSGESFRRTHTTPALWTSSSLWTYMVWWHRYTDIHIFYIAVEIMFAVSKLEKKSRIYPSNTDSYCGFVVSNNQARCYLFVSMHNFFSEERNIYLSIHHCLFVWSVSIASSVALLSPPPPSQIPRLKTIRPFI